MRTRLTCRALPACAAIVCLAAACDNPTPDFHVAYAEIVAEEDARGDIGLERIHRHLASANPELRALAVRALGRLEDPDQIEGIADLLDDAAGTVREAAAAAMAQAVFGKDSGPVTQTLAARIEVEVDPVALGGLATNIGRLAFRTPAERAEADAALVSAAQRLPTAESDPAMAARVGLARGVEAFARSARAAGEDGAALSPALVGAATALSTLPGAAAARVRRLAVLALVHGDQLGTEAARSLLQDEDWGVRRQVIMAATRHSAPTSPPPTPTASPAWPPQVTSTASPSTASSPTSSSRAAAPTPTSTPATAPTAATRSPASRTGAAPSASPPAAATPAMAKCSSIWPTTYAWISTTPSTAWWWREWRSSTPYRRAP